MEVFLATKRLLLRRFTAADVDGLVELDGDPEVRRFLADGRTVPREVIERETLPGILDVYRRYPGFGYWAAITKADSRFVGWVGLVPEGPAGEASAGWRLLRSAWGSGYATEGARALIRKGFTEQGVLRVTATTMTVNVASRRVMEKSGLAFVRTFFKEWPEYLAGAEYGDVEYAVTREDWLDAEPSDR